MKKDALCAPTKVDLAQLVEASQLSPLTPHSNSIGSTQRRNKGARVARMLMAEHISAADLRDGANCVH